MLNTKVSLSHLFSSWFKELEPDFLKNHRLIEKKQQLLLNNINFLNVLSKTKHYEHIQTNYFDFSGKTIVTGKEDLAIQVRLKPLVSALIPWRKGPFSLFGSDIKSEWDCSYKWKRIASFATELFYQKEVIDLGCQNPYFLFKIFQEQARYVIGLDPHFLGYLQSAFLINLIQTSLPIYHLPINHLDWLKLKPNPVDTLLCMGVLTHQRDPKQFLMDIKHLLKPGGKLVLETMVMPKQDSLILAKNMRYAGMKNVYFLPNLNDLKRVLKEVGYTDINGIDVSCTSIDEQQSRAYSSPISLKDMLDPTDYSKTIEGYPRPHRAILIAECPKN